MFNLNGDVLYLIFEQLQDDKKTLYSCLLVNKTWCDTTIPILWKNPWIILKNKNVELLLSTIISHLSSVSRKKIGVPKLLTNPYQKPPSNYYCQKPSFNYINYCRYLNLDEMRRIINKSIYDKDKNLMVQNEILNLFISENMKFTHLYVHKNFDHQIHIIHGAERCFSEIKFLSCSTDINDNILTKLTEACKSIKELHLIVRRENNNYGIVKLIKAQNKLFNIKISYTYDRNESFCEILENSLIEHTRTIQYCNIDRQPLTNFLSSFENLKVLELSHNTQITASWNCLKNLTFPFLQILKSSSVPIEDLTCLIKNTSGSLIEITADRINHDEISNKKFIQSIYQNCPNIKYLKLLVKNSNIIEFEKLLIRCQYLNGLYILIDDVQECEFYWDKLFEALTKSSPSSLFKFKFSSYELPKLETYKLFLDNWKGRRPMFLQILSHINNTNLETIERYKEIGIVKKFDYYKWWSQKTKVFEWI
jgi:hypothetical protein